MDSVDFDPSVIISAFNLITTSHTAHAAFLSNTNRYFVSPSSLKPPERPFLLNDGLEAWKGFYASVRPTYKQLMVNINTCASPFYTPVAKLSDVLLDSRKGKVRGASWNPQEFYKNAKVTTKHLGSPRQHTIREFGPKTARETKFQADELGKKMVSVEEYFKQSTL